MNMCKTEFTNQNNQNNHMEMCITFSTCVSLQSPCNFAISVDLSIWSLFFPLVKWCASWNFVFPSLRARSRQLFHLVNFSIWVNFLLGFTRVFRQLSNFQGGEPGAVNFSIWLTLPFDDLSPWKLQNCLPECSEEHVKYFIHISMWLFWLFWFVNSVLHIFMWLFWLFWFCPPGKINYRIAFLIN